MSGELCPQCGGRKVIAVGVHEIMCAECDGTGHVKAAPTPAAGKKKHGADKPTT